MLLLDTVHGKKKWKKNKVETAMERKRLVENN